MIPSTVAVAAASLTSTTMTCAPCSANNCADACPIPDAPAVMTAILSLSNMVVSSVVGLVRQ